MQANCGRVEEFRERERRQVLAHRESFGRRKSPFQIARSLLDQLAGGALRAGQLSRDQEREDKSVKLAFDTLYKKNLWGGAGNAEQGI